MLSDDSFILQSWVVGKIGDDTKAIAGRFQIIVNLSAVLVGEFFNGFEFKNDFAKADQVGHIGCLQLMLFIVQFS